jgi:DNA helicase-2/ATP-dependent DNA helicase PcrA
MAFDTLISLNKEQKEAVEHVFGPVLILAGPGSGKTRVITHRIAYLINELGVDPFDIAAVTFTNKAASEMRQRLFGIDEMVDSSGLLGNVLNKRDFTVSTFHSLCSLFLRSDGIFIGLEKDFVIYDRDDQLTLITKAMEISEIDPKRFSNRAILDNISSAKSKLITSDDYTAGPSNPMEKIIETIYKTYQNLLEKNNGVDFDDLLLKTNILFNNNPSVLDKYQSRYKYLMIDEFQDTNMAQYNLANKIAGKHKNICVVGDPDQSIYSWRNADIRNILSFQQDYPECKVISLNQNYRSTSTILDGAYGVISKNTQRIERKLTTNNPKGDPIFVGEAYNPEEEAQLVMKEIKQLKAKRGYSFNDFAIMYRVNSQSRAFEEGCLRNGIPYKLIGGLRFYQRKEVKDVIAYLRVVLNHHDDVSLLRIINTPPRGIGQKTVDEIIELSDRNNISMYTAMQLISDSKSNEGHNKVGRSRRVVSIFVDLVTKLIHESDGLDPGNVINLVFEIMGYRKYLEDQGDQGSEKMENIEELKVTAHKFQNVDPEDRLIEFLQGVALVSDIDSLDDSQDSIALITLHQAKGLEFPTVFIVGMEEGLLPHIRSFDYADQIEEERRVFYVGMTRAKEILYITRSFRRGYRGNGVSNIASRFLMDIPNKLVSHFSSRVKPLGTIATGVTNKSYTKNQATTFSSRVKPLGIIAAGVTNKSYATDETTTHDSIEKLPIGIGQKVRHNTFGLGIVVSCTSIGYDYQVTVAFKLDGGIRNLLWGYANLELLD